MSEDNIYWFHLAYGFYVGELVDAPACRPATEEEIAEYHEAQAPAEAG